MAIKEKLDRFIKKTKDILVNKSDEIRKLNKDTYREFLKKNLKIIILIGIVMFLLSGYFVGNMRTTKEQLFKKLEIGLEDGSVSKLQDIIRVNDKKLKKKDLAPLIAYYKGQDSQVNNVIDGVKEGNEKSIFELVNEKGIFGDNYYVNLKTFNLKVVSNFKDANIYLNGKEKVNSGDTLNNLIPGKYKISGSIANEYGEIKKEEEISLMKDETVELKLDGIMVTVDSKFGDANVFINGKDSGIKCEDFRNIGPMPTDGSIKLSIQKEFPWGVVKGEESEVLQTPNISLKLDISNDALWNEINTSLNTFYKSVFEALNSEDKGAIEGATNEAMDKIYSVIEKQYFILKNNYEMKSLDIDKEKSNFQYKNGEYKATIVCEVKYDTSKVLFGLGRKENSKKFLTKLIYKSNKWTVDDVENFSL